MARILITGGAGFVGSHAAEFYAQRGHDVLVYDNLSRGELLKKDSQISLFNWKYLEKFKNIERWRADIRDARKIEEAAKDIDVIIHAAAQTAVTTSVIDPRVDFEVNALGSFNVLEAARLSKSNPVVISCSTNKVYGENVNKIKILEKEKRYEFEDPFKEGVPESMPVDHCEHTPYGCSKLTSDLYAQDYSRLYGLKTGIFRMSCIYGTRQFGVEDQGWVAWFTIATILGKPITIYGDGKQVRDTLYISDLVNAFDAFIKSKLKHAVFNIGGGPEKTISLLELLDLLEKLTGKRSKTIFSDWRPSDQKVYISNINKAKEILKWKPAISPKEGVKKLIEWVDNNKKLFSSNT